MRKSKRAISKAKMYGFNPWVDQIDNINQLVAESGANEATVLRKLIDEALMARRRKVFDEQLVEPSSEQPVSGQLQAVERLLAKLVLQEEVSLRVQDVSLALLQDTLAETRAGRKATWEQVSSHLKERGLTRTDISKRFDDETKAAKSFAYGLARDLKRQQAAERAKSKQASKQSS
jgi:hypothetical protein